MVPAPKDNPFTTSENVALPATADVGDKLVSVSPPPCPCEMVNGSGVGEGCPGAVTPTEAIPTTVNKLAGTVAVSCVEETNVVLSAVPFQTTSVSVVNPEPPTVSVNVGPPGKADAGEMLVSVNGLPVCGVIVNVSGLGCGCALILTAAVPGDTNNDVGTMAVSCEVETNVVCNRIPFQVTLLPDDGKLEPLTVSVSPGVPATVEFGDRLVSVGRLLVMVKVSELEGVLPFCTVTEAEPACAIRPAGTAAVT